MDVIPNTSSKSESPNHADLEFRSLMNGPTELILLQVLKTIFVVKENYLLGCQRTITILSP
jgi:hypothetical protein